MHSRWWWWLLAVVAPCPHLHQSHFEIPSLPSRIIPWDATPDPDGTGNLIFHSISSLLQLWPNIRHRNGHAVVPATIRPGTVLYHGRTDGDVPTTLGWLATDPDQAFPFCNAACHISTFVATRELRMLYFDGSSASKMVNGTMDSQDVLFWGEVNEDKTYNEGARIMDACAWGADFGLDGYVRMEVDFEMMMCNLSDGLQLLSNSKIVPPRGPQVRPLPGKTHHPPEIPFHWKGSIRPFESVAIGLIEAGLWHDHAPGETRVKVDYSRLFTFFDPALTSLVAARRCQTRDEYRVADISAEDAKTAQAVVAGILLREEKGSGIDWSSIVQVAIDTYGSRLALVRYLLENPGSRSVIAQTAQVRSQILLMLTPYMLADAIPTSASGSRSWVAPIAEQCASTLTAWAPTALLTRQEKVIKGAIDEVLHEICRVLSEIWVDAFGVEEATPEEASRLVGKWRRDVTELMTWLDWSLWDVCSPPCNPEDICYAPMWPWLRGEWGWYPPDGDDMTPRCIPRVEPYAKFLEM